MVIYPLKVVHKGQNRSSVWLRRKRSMKGRQTAHTQAQSFREAHLFLPLCTETPEPDGECETRLINFWIPLVVVLCSRPPLPGCGPPFHFLLDNDRSGSRRDLGAGGVAVKTPRLRQQSPKIAPNLHPPPCGAIPAASDAI